MTEIIAEYDGGFSKINNPQILEKMMKKYDNQNTLKPKEALEKLQEPGMINKISEKLEDKNNATIKELMKAFHEVIGIEFHEEHYSYID